MTVCHDLNCFVCVLAGPPCIVTFGEPTSDEMKKATTVAKCSEMPGGVRTLAALLSLPPAQAAVPKTDLDGDPSSFHPPRRGLELGPDPDGDALRSRPLASP